MANLWAFRTKTGRVFVGSGRDKTRKRAASDGEIVAGAVFDKGVATMDEIHSDIGFAQRGFL